MPLSLLFVVIAVLICYQNLFIHRHQEITMTMQIFYNEMRGVDGTCIIKETDEHIKIIRNNFDEQLRDQKQGQFTALA